mmetsp:Transcript_5423/g.10851  ORF Transcript_5423/g.10851 Transcript_5423/m.10851 type:complete len:217 (-) Transcript_5423:23-673(-)
MEVGPGSLARPREELPELLERDEIPSLGGEAEDNPPVRKVAEVSNHSSHLFRRIVDGNVYAAHGVVVTLDALEVAGVEVGVLDAEGGGTTGGLIAHGVGNVTGTNVSTHLSERNRQATYTTPAVAHSLSADVTVVLDPIKDLLYRLVVTSPDVELHGVNFITLAVNFVPPIETFTVEVVPNLGLIINDSRHPTRCARRVMHEGHERGREGYKEEEE